MRIATYNASLTRHTREGLLNDITTQHPQVVAVCRIIAELDADILLVNEFDTVPEIAEQTISAFLTLLNQHCSHTTPGKTYHHYFTHPVNTGVLSPIDFGKDGKLTLPVDGYGFGQFPGQYGMLLLSRYPICTKSSRSFQRFLWRDLPDTVFPTYHNLPGTQPQPYFSEKDQQALRLSSKSHWNVVVQFPEGQRLHCLCSHPVPPIFDGIEKRNVYRNAAEIDFWTQYLSGNWAVRDDQGRVASLNQHESVVVLGDLNNDPTAGDGDNQAIQQLLAHPRLQDTQPYSQRFSTQKPVTADFSDQRLRVDYVLPGSDLRVRDSSVFWPPKTDPNHQLFRIPGQLVSDHYPVWVDVEIPALAKHERMPE